MRDAEGAHFRRKATGGEETLGSPPPRPSDAVVSGRALSATQAEVMSVAPGRGTPLTFIIRGRAQDPFG